MVGAILAIGSLAVSGLSMIANIMDKSDEAEQSLANTTTYLGGLVILGLGTYLVIYTLRSKK